MHSLTIPIVLLVPVSCGARVLASGLGAGQKTVVFGTAPNPLAGNLAPQDTGTNNTIGIVSECTYVQRGKVSEVYDANIAARPPQINYESTELNASHPGH